MSPAAAYTWFWMNIWFIVGFLLDTPMTTGARLISLIIASVFSYYFWIGINAVKVLSKQMRTEQENGPKDGITEKLKMAENTHGKALYRFELCLRAINRWLIVWVFLWAWFNSKEGSQLSFGVVIFLGIVLFLGLFSLWLKKKISPTSACIWVWMSVWCVVDFFMDTSMTTGTPLMSLAIASFLLYYFFWGIFTLFFGGYQRLRNFIQTKMNRTRGQY